MHTPPPNALGFFQGRATTTPGDASVSAAPQVVFLNQSHDWVPTAVNGLQFLLLAVLTYYIFRKNYKQRQMERQAEWYRRLVTDFAVEEITDFSQNASATLADIAKQVAKLKGISAPSAALDMAIQKGLGDFKEALYNMMRLVAGRLLVFDKTLEQSMVNSCTDLEDHVTEWFATEATSAPGEPREGLFQILNDWQSDVLKLIRDYEFQHWS